MNRILTIKKLSQYGFDHVFGLVAFVVIIGLAGTGYLILSHAANWSGALSLNDGSMCMEATGYSAGDYVTLDNCGKSQLNQKWELVPDGTYNNKAAYVLETYASNSNMCVDDWQQSTSVHQNYARLYKCNPSDPAQLLIWTNFPGADGLTNDQLMNPHSGICLDDYQAKTTPGNKIDWYTCKFKTDSSVWNQEWFETGNSASATSSGSNSGGGSSGGLQQGTQGLITASVGNNMCVTQTGSEIVLATCNSGNTSDEWVQLNNSGAGTEVFQNVASHSYLGSVASENAGTALTPQTNQNSATTDWTAGGTGPNTLTIGVLTTTPSGNDAPCMSAPNGNAGTVIVLAVCGSSSTNQLFSLPVAYNGNPGSGGGSPSSGSNGSSGNCTFAATASACQSELNSGSGSNSSSSNATTNEDLQTIFQTIQSRDPNFQCSSISTSSARILCDGIFKQ